jgi:hypothetical protein
MVQKSSALAAISMFTDGRITKAISKSAQKMSHHRGITTLLETHEASTSVSLDVALTKWSIN